MYVLQNPPKVAIRKSATKSVEKQTRNQGDKESATNWSTNSAGKSN